MMAYTMYLAKVALCSGILVGYYWLALRNKTFHQWNRFYLLAAVLFSLVAPLLTITIGQAHALKPNPVLRILHVVSGEPEVVVESGRSHLFAFSPEQYLVFAYVLVSLALLLLIGFNARRIIKILRAYPKTRIGTVYFLNTDAAGTPFTFLQYIFWNRNIDLDSETGRRIFEHELAHVQQRHTWDKLFLLLILVPFWINPFFWIIRKEIHALHEFAADRKAMQQHDASELAQLILNTAFPQHQFLFTNHLFQSTIKRRLAMFTKLQNPTVSYVSRIAALPLLLIVMTSFALKLRPLAAKQLFPSNKTITVVIDAGHGGKEGAQWDNVSESDLVLAIAKKIKAQNRNSNLRILLTRENNQVPDLKQRVQMAADNKADLFLSLHVNTANAATANTSSGMEVVVSSKNPPYQQQSEILGSALVQQLSAIHDTKKELITPESGIWVLDHNVCPSVLIELGYLTDKKDLQFIKDKANQTRIANKILEAIAQYGVLKNTTSSLTDTLPARVYADKAVADVQYFEWPKQEVHLFFADGTKDTISYSEAKAANLFDSGAISRIEHKPWTIEKVAAPELASGDFSVRKASLTEANRFTGIILLDDKRFNGTFRQLPVSENEIAFISFIKGNAFDDVIGTKLGSGDSILAISTKTYIKANQRTDNQPLFTQTEIEPKFPEANGGWKAFLQKNLDASVAVKNGAKPGNYKVIVGFIVDTDGKIYDIKPLTHLGFGMEEEVMKLMKLSPDWIPAMQNGKKVTAYKKQPITFIIAEG